MKRSLITGNRDNRAKRTVLTLSVTAFMSVFFFLSLSPAASWDPADTLKSYLAENYPWEEIEVHNVRVAGTLSNDPPERIFVEKGPIGNAVFSFISRDSKRTIVKAKVRAFGLVVKSKRSFKRNHVLGADDVYVAKMDVRKMPGSSVQYPSDIVGKSLKRSIMANIPIVEGMIELFEVVERGQMVVLLINNNGLSIRAAGMTKEKGYVGMPVRAINQTSKKEVNGVLIDEKTVKIEL